MTENTRVEAISSKSGKSESNPNFLKQEDKSATVQETESNDTDKTKPVKIVRYTGDNAEVIDAEFVEEIVSTTAHSVSHVIINIDKVSQTAFDTDKNITLYQDIARRLGMEPDGSNDIDTFVSINFDFDKMEEKGAKISGTEKLTPFDKLVLDAINTLYIEGENEYISTGMIFHVLTGDKHRRISAKYAEDINNSLIKLLFTHITIDATEEAKMYHKLKDFKYHGTILPGDMVQAKINGIKVSCVHVLKKSPLYSYASIKKQISRVDLRLIQKPFAHDKKESKEQMLLLYYLLGRIIALKSLSNRIRYDTLYHEFGYDKAIKQYKLQFRKRVKAILDAWKGLVFGDIELVDYEEEKKDQQPHVIVLHYKIIK